MLRKLSEVSEGREAVIAAASSAPASVPPTPSQVMPPHWAVLLRSRKLTAFAANVLPIVETIRSSGVTTLAGITDALNARGIRSARGGRWRISSLQNLFGEIGERKALIEGKNASCHQAGSFSFCRPIG